MELKKIGTVHSQFKEFSDVIHLRRGWTSDSSVIKLESMYRKGLGGLQGYSHVIILFWLDKHKKWKIPKDNNKPPHVKVFATRMPVRPNPIGLSVVELLEFSPEKGILVVKGLDAIDGTPILDIKPYLPHFDSYADASIPQWVEEHLKKHHHGDGHGHTHD